MDFESIEGLSETEIVDLYENMYENDNSLAGCSFRTVYECSFWRTDSKCEGGTYITSNSITSFSTCKSNNEAGEKALVKCLFLTDQGERGSVSCVYSLKDGYPKSESWVDNTYSKWDVYTSFGYIYSRCTVYNSTYGEIKGLRGNSLEYFDVTKTWYCT